ncbi:MAG TPA: biotin/lipoyl-containing protein, partial [Solirubrobacterales bacterium]
MAETATVQIAMPEMGESVTEGIVLEWHVAEGDTVSEGDTVVEVSTDKVDAEVPAPMDGVITKLLVAVDDEVPVGAPMAEMEAGDGSSEGSQASAAGPGGGETPAGEDVASFSDSPPGHPQVGAGNGGGTAAGSDNGSADVRATP